MMSQYNQGGGWGAQQPQQQPQLPVDPNNPDPTNYAPGLPTKCRSRRRTNLNRRQSRKYWERAWVYWHKACRKLPPRTHYAPRFSTWCR